MYNFTDIIQHFSTWTTQGYYIVFGSLFLPLMYMGIVGYIYVRMRSATAGAIAILVIFTAIGDMFLDVGILVSAFHIFVSLIFAILVVAFLSRMRG